jgi:hypothetical protein
MRKLSILIFSLCLFTEVSSAAKLEVFAGGQYSHLDPNFNLVGWNLAATVNGGHFLGVTGDLSGVYRNGLNFHTYTVGPEVHASLPLIKPFVHGLIGGARSAGEGISANGFVGMIGGGVDMGSGLIAFRPIQVDWMATRFSGLTNQSSKNFRGSAGLVLRF